MEAASEQGASSHAILGKHYDLLMTRIREGLVKIPPKTPVPWSDTPSDLLAPSEVDVGSETL